MKNTEKRFGNVSPQLMHSIQGTAFSIKDTKSKGATPNKTVCEKLLWPQERPRQKGSLHVFNFLPLWRGPTP